MLPTCEVYGNTDLYGLGVRIGYYLQWLSLLFGAWVCPREVPKLRIANTFYISAIFFALVLQIRDDSLDDVDIYVTLLFTFGPTMYTCIFLAWHIATSYNIHWDLNRHSSVKPAGLLFISLQAGLLIAQFGFQIWFWSVRLGRSSYDSCVQYGFHFGKVRLHDAKFRFFNVGMSLLALLLTTTYIFFKLKPGVFTSSFRSASQTTIIPSKIKAFLFLNTASNVSVATTTIIATELCIRWNKISGVTSINSAGQTVPLLLGIGCSVRVAYVGARSMLENQASKTIANVQELTTALLGDISTSVTDDNSYPLENTGTSPRNSELIEISDAPSHPDNSQTESTDQELTTSVVISIAVSQRGSRASSSNLPPVIYQKRVAPESPIYKFCRTYNKVKSEDNVDSIQRSTSTHDMPAPIINDTNDVTIHNPSPLSKTPAKTVTIHENVSVYEPRAGAYASAVEGPRSIASATDYTGFHRVHGSRKTPTPRVRIHNYGGQTYDSNTSTNALNGSYHA